MVLIGENNPAGCTERVSGGEEASDSSTEKQRGSHSRRSAFFFLSFCLFSSACSLFFGCGKLLKAAAQTGVQGEFSVATVVLPVWLQQKFDNIGLQIDQGRGGLRLGRGG